MDFIDLRSDTVTVPTVEMKKAFLLAQYGSMNQDEDPVLQQLQKQAAQIFGKQSASFVPSGTFGNQCAILTHTKPGEEILLPRGTHVIQYQTGGLTAISRIMTRQIEPESDSLISLEGLKKAIRKPQKFSPKQTIFTVENPTSSGKVYSVEKFNELAKCAKENNLIVHLDGARIFNACTHLNLDPKILTQKADTISLCLSKALSMPIGSIVAGPKEFIDRFNVNRYMLGGIFQKPGMFAAMALVSLRKVRFQLYKDHEIAKSLANRLKSEGWIEIVGNIQINMIFFKFTDPRLQPKKFQQYLLSNGVKSMLDLSEDPVKRFMVHNLIRYPEIQRIIYLFRQYTKILDEQE